MLAVDDELDTHVPETTALTAEMGIKHETSLSIARPTHVSTPECGFVELEERTSTACECAIEGGIVVSTLTNERPDFMDGFAEHCRPVICYRISPAPESIAAPAMSLLCFQRMLRRR